MSFRHVSLFVLGLGVAALGAHDALAQEGGSRGGRPYYRDLELSEVPAPARDTAQRELGSANFSEMEERFYHNDRVYEFKARTPAGDEHSVIVDQAGKVLEKK
ncbi:MAG: PepSY domain-containing protein [Alphaproteobacteria bacterium]|nr:PepSY domain-containing protein [Alphaproteobacteria bacterium]